MARNEQVPIRQADGYIVYIELDATQPLGFRLALNGASQQIGETAPRADDELHARNDEAPSIADLPSDSGCCPATQALLEQDVLPGGCIGSSTAGDEVARVNRINCSAEGIRVARVRRRSQAYKCGLRENDSIVQVSGYDASLTYDAVMEHLLAQMGGSLTLTIKRGRENDPIAYPSFAYVEDSYSSVASPIPLGSPMATTTNVCCLHGVQSRALHISPRPAAITSGSDGEQKLSNDSNESSSGWLPQLKKLAEWFQFMKPDEKPISKQLPELRDSISLPAATTPAPSSSSPNSCPWQEPTREEHRHQDEQSWVTHALQRYANIENLPKMPTFMAKQPSQESECESISETARIKRILKVVTYSSAPLPARLEQRTSCRIKTITVPRQAPCVSVNLPLSTGLKPLPAVQPEATALSHGSGSFTSNAQKLRQTNKPTAFMAARRSEKGQERTPNSLLRTPTTQTSTRTTFVVRTPPPRFSRIPTPSTPASAPSTASHSALVHLHAKPSGASELVKQDEREEESDGTDSGEGSVKQKLRLARPISVPTIVRHRGAITVHMHLKTHKMSMVPMASDDEEPLQRVQEQVPVIVIEEDKGPEPPLAREQAALSEDRNQNRTSACYESTSPAPQSEHKCDFRRQLLPPSDYMHKPDSLQKEPPPEPTYIPDEVRLPQFETTPGQKTTWLTVSAERAPLSTMKKAQIISHSRYEEPDEEVATPTSSQPESENSTQFPSESENAAPLPEAAFTEAPVYTTFEFPSSLIPVPEAELELESDKKKLTVTDISRHWPPPSNATGVKIVKDAVGQSEADGEETQPTVDSRETSKKMDALKWHLFDDGVAEKVRACRSIVDELNASSENLESQSKAQRMFTKRKQRSAKYVISSPGPEVCADSEVRTKIDKPTPQPAENGDHSKGIRRTRNPAGDTHDFQEMKKRYGDIVTDLASAEKCQEISQALKSLTSSSKGAEMFLRRRNEAQAWEADAHPPTAPCNQPAASGVHTPGRHELNQQSRLSAGLPPIPVPSDAPRPFRRELERIASPMPTVDWSLHDRHERLFSPVPFSTRIRTPSLERVVFAPFSRPFTPVVLAEPTTQPSGRAQSGYGSPSIASDRLEPTEIRSRPPAFDVLREERRIAPLPVSANAPTVLPSTASGAMGTSLVMFPPTVHTFNRLPRSWKSYSDAYRRRGLAEATRPP